MKRWIPTLIFLLAASSAAHAAPGLTDLIKSGEREAALELIRVGAEVNAAAGDGSTPLLWAVYNLDEEMTRLLLAREANPNAQNKYGASPLSEAVKTANVELTRLLLEAGADPDSANADGQTALMLAARTGRVEVAERLIRHGASLNAREQWRGQSALMLAAASGQAAMTQLLIEHGADVAVRAKANDWGSQITSEPRAQYRPSGGLTPLLYAARSGCVDCVQAILDAGAEIDQPSPDGITPLMVAIDNYRFDAAALLLEEGANPHLWDWWGRTPLYVATDVKSYQPRSGATLRPDEQHSALDIMTMLLEAGVDPDPRLNMHRPGRGGNSGRFTDDMLTTGATPLLRAAYSHDLEAVRLLLAHGAQVDLPNVMGVTPFMVAAGFGADRGQLIRGFYDPGTEAKVRPVLEELLAAGADINASIRDTTSHNARIARLSSMTDRQGQTALFAAAKQGWAGTVSFLLDNGASLDVRDDQGKSALDAARGNAGGRVDRSVEATVALLEQLMAEAGDYP